MWTSVSFPAYQYFVETHPCQWAWLSFILLSEGVWATSCLLAVLWVFGKHCQLLTRHPCLYVLIGWHSHPYNAHSHVWTCWMKDVFIWFLVCNFVNEMWWSHCIQQPSEVFNVSIVNFIWRWLKSKNIWEEEDLVDWLTSSTESVAAWYRQGGTGAEAKSWQPIPGLGGKDSNHLNHPFVSSRACVSWKLHLAAEPGLKPRPCNVEYGHLNP